jgi:hypothetical protein
MEAQLLGIIQTHYNTHPLAEFEVMNAAQIDGALVSAATRADPHRVIRHLQTHCDIHSAQVTRSHDTRRDAAADAMHCPDRGEADGMVRSMDKL